MEVLEDLSPCIWATLASLSKGTHTPVQARAGMVRASCTTCACEDQNVVNGVCGSPWSVGTGCADLTLQTLGDAPFHPGKL